MAEGEGAQPPGKEGLEEQPPRAKPGQTQRGRRRDSAPRSPMERSPVVASSRSFHLLINDLPRRRVAKKGQHVYACPQKNSQERVALILKERPNSNKQNQKNHDLLVCRLSRYEKINWCWILLQKRR